MRLLLTLAAAAMLTVTSIGCQTASVCSSCNTSAMPAMGGGFSDGGCDGCDGGCDDGSCGSGVVQTGGLIGGLRARRASQAGYETLGCGVGGCGMGGRLCGNCGGLGGGALAGGLSSLRLKNRAAANHPYGGQSPHTPPSQGPHGAMAPTYGYPYYTTRGPRDFLMSNPPSLGR